MQFLEINWDIWLPNIATSGVPLAIIGWLLIRLINSIEARIKAVEDDVSSIKKKTAEEFTKISQTANALEYRTTENLSRMSDQMWKVKDELKDHLNEKTKEITNVVIDHLNNKR